VTARDNERAALLLDQVAELSPEASRRVYRHSVPGLRARLVCRAARSKLAPGAKQIAALVEIAIGAIEAQVPERYTLPGWLEQATPVEVSRLLTKAAGALRGEPGR